MMKIETINKIETLKNKINNNFFTEKDCQGIISLQTLRRYNLIEYVFIETHREEITLEQLIKEINSMIGEDCYYDKGEYIQENGKIFYIINEWGYRFKD